ncbi:MAG: TadE/TadG family type IV pilus assembly protein, partial [Candidatus Dormibacteraceae bacterium]
MRRRQGGQSMIEFAFVVIPFLFALLGALTAGLNAFEREVAEGAAASGVQLAATSQQPGDPTRVDLSAAIEPTLRLLRPAMLGTAVQALPAGQPCPAVSTMPPGTVDVCVWLDPAVRGAYGRPALVAETIR